MSAFGNGGPFGGSDVDGEMGPGVVTPFDDDSNPSHTIPNQPSPTPPDFLGRVYAALSSDNAQK